MTMTQTITSTRPFEGLEIPAPGTYSYDVGHSHVGFAVRHLMVSKTRGRFTSFGGSLAIAEDPLESSIDVTIDVASVDSHDEQRDGHLRSADFFDAEQFPTIHFVSTGVRHVGGSDFEVDGDLTVRDVTRPVVLKVEFEGATTDPWGNDRVGFTASAKLNREDWGLTWNQALETGGVLVGKDVTIDIEVEATRNA
jgi:polyisoprenoid-binding protein YceI